MKVIAAIDLLHNECVRLYKGNYNQVTVYSNDPVDMAKKFQTEGADIIHVVDLEGALKGMPVHFDTIVNIQKNVRIPVEVGGGIRNIDSIKKYWDAGIKRIILGSSVVLNEKFASDALTHYKNNIIFGIDAREDNIAVNGWIETTSYKVIETIQKYEKQGLQEIIYTDINKDGAMEGPNLEMLKKILNESNVKIIASGGISSLKDISYLRTISDKFMRKKIYGCILGKAIYENKLTVGEVKKSIYGP
ncbi:MAG: 1-(5-phosphoribosyl)-5-[(5-phosphoribosylamino)methylideneamino]imidazole-4-carboxamide isomerase [Candidatus Margulisbacteria bacterium]|nr:1-(5-phosphoribosyl)-5-[(5-phosphoribosylamino)methylideneamino]imidazole-4-carboxamide isomerase [Candidatus Margulisiibacteriota bacterium]